MTKYALVGEKRAINMENKNGCVKLLIIDIMNDMKQISTHSYVLSDG